MKARYIPAAVKNGKVSKAHKTYANPGPAKADAVRFAKAAGGKPVVVRSSGKGSSVPARANAGARKTLRRNKDMRGKLSKSKATTRAWQAHSRFESSGWADKSAAKALTDMLGWDVLEHFVGGDPRFWDGELQDRIEKKFGLPAHMNPNGARIRSNGKSRKDATFHRDGTVTFWSVIEQSWRSRVPVRTIWRHPYSERDSFSDQEWNRIGRLAGAKHSDHDARSNPKRLVVCGHTITRSSSGYRIDAYGVYLPSLKDVRAHLKRHLAKERTPS